MVTASHVKIAREMGIAEGIELCAAGPWRPIKDAGKPEDLVLLWVKFKKRSEARLGCWNYKMGYWWGPNWCECFTIKATHFAIINEPK